MPFSWAQSYKLQIQSIEDGQEVATFAKGDMVVIEGILEGRPAKGIIAGVTPDTVTVHFYWAMTEFAWAEVTSIRLRNLGGRPLSVSGGIIMVAGAGLGLVGLGQFLGVGPGPFGNLTGLYTLGVGAGTFGLGAGLAHFRGKKYTREEYRFVIVRNP
ncbi:MAG TPA: hypothetical protein DCE41_36195 [Cytophagales bacterium]|nr:hypothetical protein [Cytophagales bacterium]